jgi:hypothetical protein
MYVMILFYSRCNTQAFVMTWISTRVVCTVPTEECTWGTIQGWRRMRIAAPGQLPWVQCQEGKRLNSYRQLNLELYSCMIRIQHCHSDLKILFGSLKGRHRHRSRGPLSAICTVRQGHASAPHPTVDHLEIINWNNTWSLLPQIKSLLHSLFNSLVGTFHYKFI